MLVGNVGGDPADMTGGAAKLTTAAAKVHDTGPALGRLTIGASGSAGYPDLEQALTRFGAAVGSSLEDLGTQCQLAAQLAQNAAHDLVLATGG